MKELIYKSDYGSRSWINKITHGRKKYKNQFLQN